MTTRGTSYIYERQPSRGTATDPSAAGRKRATHADDVAAAHGIRGHRYTRQLDDALRAKLETGAITTTDADELRDFAAFLRESGPPPGSAGHDPARYTAAYRDIYGDEEGLTL